MRMIKVSLCCSRALGGLLLTGLALTAIGCGAVPLTAGDTIPCAMQVSGAQAAQFPCTSSSAIWTASRSQSAVSMESSDGRATVAITISVELRPGIFASADTLVAFGGATLRGATNQVWRSTKGGSADQGSFTLTLTSVTVALSAAAGTIYTVHGSLDATMPEVSSSGASGTATMHVTF